jgi:Zn-dependent M28 family amino/carboxypeptidase
MLGAHFDSWHNATGATDNAGSSAVMMEAMRILKASGLPLRRTVRMALWTGEEQGLIGSRQYVRQHFGTADSTKPGHAKVSAYFNQDNGGGAIRGVWAQGNEAVVPIFKEWMKALDSDSITVRHVTLNSTGSTDHVAFDAVGIPGFQFLQDPMEYSTRTHHSSQDFYERLVPADMRHNAVVLAAFVYLAANRDEMLPRKGAVQ